MILAIGSKENSVAFYLASETDSYYFQCRSRVDE